MEGQVRGIARMIEREEYCVDILQQTAALRAAVDALSILVLEDHVQGCVRTAAEHGEADEYVDEVIDVVRRTLGRPVRGTRPARPSRARPLHGLEAGTAASSTRATSGCAAGTVPDAPAIGVGFRRRSAGSSRSRTDRASDREAPMTDPATPARIRRPDHPSGGGRHARPSTICTTMRIPHTAAHRAPDSTPAAARAPDGSRRAEDQAAAQEALLLARALDILADGATAEARLADLLDLLARTVGARHAAIVADGTDAPGRRRGRHG